LTNPHVHLPHVSQNKSIIQCVYIKRVRAVKDHKFNFKNRRPWWQTHMSIHRMFVPCFLLHFCVKREIIGRSEQELYFLPVANPTIISNEIRAVKDDKVGFKNRIVAKLTVFQTTGVKMTWTDVGFVRIEARITPVDCSKSHQLSSPRVRFCIFPCLRNQQKGECGASSCCCVTPNDAAISIRHFWATMLAKKKNEKLCEDTISESVLWLYGYWYRKCRVTAASPRPLLRTLVT